MRNEINNRPELKFLSYQGSEMNNFWLKQRRGFEGLIGTPLPTSLLSSSFPSPPGLAIYQGVLIARTSSNAKLQN